MQAFLDLFMSVYVFMRDTTVISFTIGEGSITLTFLNLTIGGLIAILGIDVLHHVFEW